MSDNDDENNDNIIIIIDQELRTKILDKFQQRVREMIKQTMEGVPPKLTLTYKQASRILLKDKGRVAKEIDDEILNDLLDDLRRGGYPAYVDAIRNSSDDPKRKEYLWSLMLSAIQTELYKSEHGIFD